VALADYRVEPDGVAVATSAGAMRARMLVGADGAGSLVRKRLDADRARATPIRLFRAELPSAGRARDARGDEMVYDFTPMLDGLRGYLWVFPVPGGRWNVGLMHSPTAPLSGGELAALLHARLRDHGLALGDAPLRGWPAWGYLPARRVAAPRVLTVGDAAGIDALTGEGIAVGMEHGLLAGRAIAEARATSDFSFAGYRRALRRADVGRDLALDRWLARLLYPAAAASYRRFLSLVLCDEQVIELYAARVSGALVLADRKRALARALAAHVVHARARRRLLAEAERAAAPPPAPPAAPCARDRVAPSIAAAWTFESRRRSFRRFNRRRAGFRIPLPRSAWKNSIS
jgi:flavin-dependent dehydrogenase